MRQSPGRPNCLPVIQLLDKLGIADQLPVWRDAQIKLVNSAVFLFP